MYMHACRSKERETVDERKKDQTKDSTLHNIQHFVFLRFLLQSCVTSSTLPPSLPPCLLYPNNLSFSVATVVPSPTSAATILAAPSLTTAAR